MKLTLPLLAALPAVMFLAACSQPKLVAVRMDGQSIQSNAALIQTFEADKTICEGEMQKANLSGVTLSGGGFAGLAAQMERDQGAQSVFKGCLAQKGYALVPEDQAAKKLSEYQATAAINKPSR